VIRLPDGTPVTVSGVAHWLRASLHHGTPRPPRTAQGVSDERRAELDHEARLERAQRVGIAPGEHPAPMHLDIQDLLDSAPASDADPTVVAAWITEGLSALGLRVDGQLLDALCPWCGGRDARHPAGGARTMRVRLVVDWRDRDAAHAEGRDVRLMPVVICEGVGCSPPAADADPDEAWRGHPAWLQGDWEWLRGRIEHADEARRLEAAQVARMTGVEVEHVRPACWCGAGSVAGEAGCCSMAHRKTAERRSQRERARGGRRVGGSAA
jgi:hypothetical protein